MAFEMQEEGVLAKKLAGSEFNVGEPIALMVEDDASFEAFQAAESAGALDLSALQSTDAPADAEVADPPSVAAPSGPVSVPGRTVAPEFLLSPAASHLAHSRGIDVSSLAGSGKGGRIMKGDILVAISKGTAFPPLAETSAATAPGGRAAQSPASEHEASSASTNAAPGASAASVPQSRAPINADVGPLSGAPAEDVAASTMRKVIARRLTESKTSVPHFYVSVECDIDQVLALRKQLINEVEATVSVNDMIIRAAALALRDVPEANASFDAGSNKTRLNDSIDVSVAVATPTGLITPIVKNADKLGLKEISEAVRDLAGRAKAGKLMPEEYQGGTFSVSNLGMFGISEFSAVINPPQACIMAVGSGTKKVVVGPDSEPRLATIMTSQISCDRRVVDEATASQFLQAFRTYMSEPRLLML